MQEEIIEIKSIQEFLNLTKEQNNAILESDFDINKVINLYDKEEEMALELLSGLRGTPVHEQASYEILKKFVKKYSEEEDIYLGPRELKIFKSWTGHPIPPRWVLRGKFPSEVERIIGKDLGIQEYSDLMVKVISDLTNQKQGKEMNKEEKTLREYIRKKITRTLREQEEREYELRKIIRQLLREGDISDIHPHRSTAINTLEDVLKKAIPTLRKDYKNLTTDANQRSSFRSHILKAIKDSLMPAMNNAKYGAGGALLSEPAPDDVKSMNPKDTKNDEDEKYKSAGDDDFASMLKSLEEAEIGIDVGDEEREEKFSNPIDEPEGNKKLNVEPDEEPDEKEDFGIEGEDETGRNMAYTSFRKISQYILDAFDMLANPKDKEVFIDYLLTNLKLYFDKFETELKNTVEEPDSPEPQ